MPFLSAARIAELMDPPLETLEVIKCLQDGGYIEWDAAAKVWVLTSLGEKHGRLFNVPGRPPVIRWRKAMAARLQGATAG